MNVHRNETHYPLILAPAGSRPALLAAVAAGADAVYCGLKAFSARMEAKNFDLEEMIRLITFARERNVRVHLAFNTLIKPDETDPVLRILERLNRAAPPDALIFQDPALPLLARKAGFTGALHLSTLANASFPESIGSVRRMGVEQVVVPRELTVDEIRLMAAACPPDVGLEVFIHGALCYGVSGRCYWSSYLGGKSGLRGRCVQPCRRLYAQSGPGKRHFSCMDLSLDVLVKVLRTIPQVRTWKIEGRKKGPHYVYYTVSAYRMLRDEGNDPAIKKAALDLLSQSLGRAATHYHFLPQRPYNPVETTETGSGLFLGRVKGTATRPFFSPRGDLLPGDVLRVGYEDSPGHRIHRIRRSIPARGRYDLASSTGKSIPKGTPVFLVDRREPALETELKRLGQALDGVDSPKLPPSRRSEKPLKASLRRGRPLDLVVRRTPGGRNATGETGVWLSGEAVKHIKGKAAGPVWWVLPPVIWPDEVPETARRIASLIDRGARRFILNQPWQQAFFKDSPAARLWAGPFCNIANPIAVKALDEVGFAGVVVSPELGSADLLALPGQCRIPVGVVVDGSWPLCLSRVLSEAIETGTPFSSPRGEAAWVSRYEGTYWMFPNWRLDLRRQRRRLEAAGYRLFIHMDEPVPRKVRLKNRPGKWNWDLGLK